MFSRAISNLTVFCGVCYQPNRTEAFAKEENVDNKSLLSSNNTLSCNELWTKIRMDGVEEDKRRVRISNPNKHIQAAINDNYT